MTTIFDDGAVETLAKALEILKETQYLIETDGPWAGKQPTKDNIRQYSFALVDEVTEYAKELGWKDWKKPKPADPLRVADEFADILAFLGVVLDYGLKLTGISELDMAVQYRQKTKVNLERSAGKIDGYAKLELQGTQADRLAEYPTQVLTVEVAQQRAVKRGLEPSRYYSVVINGNTGRYLLESKDKAGLNTFINATSGERVVLADLSDSWWVA